MLLGDILGDFLEIGSSKRGRSGGDGALEMPFSRGIYWFLRWNGRGLSWGLSVFWA